MVPLSPSAAAPFLVPCPPDSTPWNVLSSGLFSPPSKVAVVGLGFVSLCCNLENTSRQRAGDVLFFLVRPPAPMSETITDSGVMAPPLGGGGGGGTLICIRAASCFFLLWITISVCLLIHFHKGHMDCISF